ncbi:hypothetical protein RUND412_001540 [Rhizina undulata]
MLNVGDPELLNLVSTSGPARLERCKPKRSRVPPRTSLSPIGTLLPEPSGESFVLHTKRELDLDPFNPTPRKCARKRSNAHDKSAGEKVFKLRNAEGVLPDTFITTDHHVATEARIHGKWTPTFKRKKMALGKETPELRRYHTRLFVRESLLPETPSNSKSRRFHYAKDHKTPIDSRTKT